MEGEGRGPLQRLSSTSTNIFLRQGTSGEIEAGLTSRKSLGFSAWEAVLLRVNALTVVTTTLVGQ
jgi:hypothetical protein